jgi:hypothetical protein
MLETLVVDANECAKRAALANPRQVLALPRDDLLCNLNWKLSPCFTTSKRGLDRRARLSCVGFRGQAPSSTGHHGCEVISLT